MCILIYYVSSLKMHFTKRSVHSSDIRKQQHRSRKTYTLSCNPPQTPALYVNRLVVCMSASDALLNYIMHSKMRPFTFPAAITAPALVTLRSKINNCLSISKNTNHSGLGRVDRQKCGPKDRQTESAAHF